MRLLRAPHWRAAALVGALATAGCGSGKDGTAPAASAGAPANGGGTATSTNAAGGGTSNGGTPTNNTGGSNTGGTPSNPSGGSTSGAGGNAAGGATSVGGSAGNAAGGATSMGGSAGNAGIPANGGASGASGAALSARCASGAALCDDFETGSGVPDSAKWNVVTSYSGQPSSVNSVVVDGAQHLRGAHAVHVHTETGDPVYLETRTLPGSGNHFFARAFAYFDVDPGARTMGHWGAIVGVGPKSGASQDVEVRFGGQFDILVENYEPNDALQISSSRDGFYDDGTRLPVRTWTCFEVEFDGDTDELRVFMDDAELERLHVTDWGQFGHNATPAWSPAYKQIRIGYQSWNADTPVDVWYDAIAVDTVRIGCAG
ncbi:MAG TPA: hypothetical protein VH062_00030 [Polyangiaceae bacterium]|jgi:hypothetical protein|nr:hypothetical protein [Polyangiaceae bacterium]